MLHCQVLYTISAIASLSDYSVLQLIASGVECLAAVVNKVTYNYVLVHDCYTRFTSKQYKKNVVLIIYNNIIYYYIIMPLNEVLLKDVQLHTTHPLRLVGASFSCHNLNSVYPMSKFL